MKMFFMNQVLKSYKARKNIKSKRLYFPMSTEGLRFSVSYRHFLAQHPGIPASTAAPRRWVEITAALRGAPAAGPRPARRGEPGSRGVRARAAQGVPGPGAPHGRLAIAPGTAPGIRSRPVRAAHSEFSRAGRRACSRFLEAVSRPLPSAAEPPPSPAPGRPPGVSFPRPRGPLFRPLPAFPPPRSHTAPGRGAPGPAGFCSQLRLGPSAPRPPPVPSQPRPSPCLSRQSLPPSAAFISYQLSFLAFLTSSFQTPEEIKTLPFPPKLLAGRPPPRPAAARARRAAGRAPQVSVRFVPPLPPARPPPRCHPIPSHSIPSRPPARPGIVRLSPPPPDRRGGAPRAHPGAAPRQLFSLRLGGGDDAEREADPPAAPVPAPAPTPAGSGRSALSWQKVLELKEDLKPVPAAPAEQQPLSPRSGSESAPPRGTLEFLAGTITSNEWSSPTSPEGSNDSGGSEALDKPIDNDAEGVWSPDIEQSFQEALAIYPPCGRRKIILSDEGKMYGRNELIARYIKLRTGKTRTRKQVSSHIQVLARRKAREIQAKLKDQAAKDKAMQSMATMSSAQIISATAFHSKMGLPGLPRPAYPAVSGFWQGPLPGQAGSSQDVKPFSQQPYAVQPPLPISGFESPTGLSPSPSAPAWQGRRVASSKLWMLEFSAFLEQQQDQDTYNKHLFVHIGQSSPSYNDPYLEAVDIRQIYDKFPEKKGGLKELFERGPANAFFLVKFWADLNTNIEDESRSFYGVSSQYESPENMVITCSTKVCSFGKQVVEKVETEYARYENGHYSYRIHRSPLCEYMINFIHKLKHLPEKYMMNSVLENFTILQVVTNRDTQETLLCIAYVFEVSTSDHGAQHHIYRLVKD
ncbi:transcriptional enhancer factor TEF-3 [Sylvia atricapilla]